MEMPAVPFAQNALADELQRTLSSATLLWALTSVFVLLLGALGVGLSYEAALPGIVLVTWLGSEISARMPARVPIAVCERCQTISVLPAAWLRRLWPWKHCAACGSRLHYQCRKKHLLSLFPDERVESDCFCAKCGTPVPAKSLPAEEITSRLDWLLERMPKEAAASFYWTSLQAVLASVPADAEPDQRYWEMMSALADRGPVGNARADWVLSMVKRLDAGDWEEWGAFNKYWIFQHELIKLRPEPPDPSSVLECVASMLQGSGVEARDLARIEEAVKSGLDKLKEKKEMEDDKSVRELFEGL